MYDDDKWCIGCLLQIINRLSSLIFRGIVCKSWNLVLKVSWFWKTLRQQSIFQILLWFDKLQRWYWLSKLQSNEPRIAHVVDIICWHQQRREHPQSQNNLQAVLVASDFTDVWTYCLSFQHQAITSKRVWAERTAIQKILGKTNVLCVLRVIIE